MRLLAATNMQKVAPGRCVVMVASERRQKLTSLDKNEIEHRCVTYSTFTVLAMISHSAFLNRNASYWVSIKCLLAAPSFFEEAAKRVLKGVII